ncbi:MAG: hypothetical protein PHU21_12135 [Elusimicrobia bacterium]|nr:hypothetical protein [Elusimicrobiota bacterium]
MEFDELRTSVGNELKRRFWEHKAMPGLSRGRVRMDGWLKVELTAILAEKGEVEPAFRLPKGRAAVRFADWLVEAASLPTDFAFENTKAGPESLADDVKDLRKLIKRLRKGRGRRRAALFFAVYPFGDLHEKDWAAHRARIEKTLGGPLVEDRFSFQSGVTGRLYAGMVQARVQAGAPSQPAGEQKPAGEQNPAAVAEKRRAGRPRRAPAAPVLEKGRIAPPSV